MFWSARPVICGEMYFLSKTGRTSKKNQTPALAIIDTGCPGKPEIFEWGLTDYLTTPFIAAEVLTRLQAHTLQYRSERNRGIYSENELINHTCQFLLENLSFNQGLEKLSRLMGTNRNTLSEAFRAEFGKGAIGWLREQRLRTAAGLIVGTDKSIDEISYSVGYENPNNFSTSFRKEFNLSPRQYRRKMRRSKKSMSQEKVERGRIR